MNAPPVPSFRISGLNCLFSASQINFPLSSSYVIAPVYKDVDEIPETDESTYAFTDCCDGT